MRTAIKKTSEISTITKNENITFVEVRIQNNIHYGTQ